MLAIIIGNGRNAEPCCTSVVQTSTAIINCRQRWVCHALSFQNTEFCPLLPIKGLKLLVRWPGGAESSVNNSHTPISWPGLHWGQILIQRPSPKGESVTADKAPCPLAWARTCSPAFSNFPVSFWEVEVCRHKFGLTQNSNRTCFPVISSRSTLTSWPFMMKLLYIST